MPWLPDHMPSFLPSSAVAATRHDEADFPLAEGGPKARASQRAMPLWFPRALAAAFVCRDIPRRRAVAPMDPFVHRNRRYEREERRLSHDAAEKKNTKGRGAAVASSQPQIWAGAGVQRPQRVAGLTPSMPHSDGLSVGRPFSRKRRPRPR